MSESHIRGGQMKKKAAMILMSIFALCLLLSVKGEAKVRAPKMQCHAYVVMDAGSGEILFGQDENKMIYPASTTKLMTAIVCVENGDVNKKIRTTEEIINGTTYGTYCWREVYLYGPTQHQPCLFRRGCDRYAGGRSVRFQGSLCGSHECQMCGARADADKL